MVPPFQVDDELGLRAEPEVSIPGDPDSGNPVDPPPPCDSLDVVVVQVVGAIVLFVVVAFVGIQALRAVSGASRERPTRPAGAEPEDVADLDVFLVCRECGTEFQVTRLGEVQVPRHCGERMEVVRRPAAGNPSLN